MYYFVPTPELNKNKLRNGKCKSYLKIKSLEMRVKKYINQAEWYRAFSLVVVTEQAFIF